MLRRARAHWLTLPPRLLASAFPVCTPSLLALLTLLTYEHDHMLGRVVVILACAVSTCGGQIVIDYLAKAERRIGYADGWFALCHAQARALEGERRREVENMLLTASVKAQNDAPPHTLN